MKALQEDLKQYGDVLECKEVKTGELKLTMDLNGNDHENIHAVFRMINGHLGDDNYYTYFNIHGHRMVTYVAFSTREKMGEMKSEIRKKDERIEKLEEEKENCKNKLNEAYGKLSVHSDKGDLIGAIDDFLSNYVRPEENRILKANIDLLRGFKRELQKEVNRGNQPVDAVDKAIEHLRGRMNSKEDVDEDLISISEKKLYAEVGMAVEQGIREFKGNEEPSTDELPFINQLRDYWADRAIRIIKGESDD
jgi:hypothetical protein